MIIENRIEEILDYLENFPDGVISDCLRKEVEYLEKRRPW